MIDDSTTMHARYTTLQPTLQFTLAVIIGD